MNHAEMKREIKDLADDMAVSILKMLGKMNLKQLASISGQKPPKAVAEALEEDTKPKGRGRPKGSGSAKAAVAKVKAKPAPRAKLVRRDGGLIERLRTGVISVLKESGDWMSAKDIGAAIGDATPDDLSFPINYLRARGLLDKQGDRSKATYRITDAGREFTGSFGETRRKKAKPSETEPANDAEPVSEDAPSVEVTESDASAT